MPTVLVPLAQDCEELEAVTIIDILRRAQIEVITASLDEKPVKASRGVVFIADMSLDEALKKTYDMIVLPGGLPGADHLNNDPRIIKLIQEMYQAGKYTAAICAAPKVLAKAGLFDDKSVTHYPGAIDATQFTKTQFQLEIPVVEDGQLITSRGPGTAMDFALTLVQTLTNAEVREKVEAGLVR